MRQSLPLSRNTPKWGNWSAAETRRPASRCFFPVRLPNLTRLSGFGPLEDGWKGERVDPDLSRFLRRTLTLVAPLLLAYLLGTVYFAFFSETNFAHERLYRYQQEKIAGRAGLDTVLIGDSSLGNAVDARHFSQCASVNAANLALTGIHGYAGSYNILKQVHRRHPNLRYVVVMQTLDISLRDTAYQGYLRTMAHRRDFLELSVPEQYRLIHTVLSAVPGEVRSLLKVRWREQVRGAVARDIDPQSDYIGQEPRRFSAGTETPLPCRGINPDKTRFLRKIVTYASSRGIGLVYLHGPLYEERVRLSGEYVRRVNSQIQATGIDLVQEVVAVPEEDLGDGADHIRPGKKLEYTRRYCDLLTARGFFERGRSGPVTL